MDDEDAGAVIDMAGDKGMNQAADERSDHADQHRAACPDQRGGGGDGRDPGQSARQDAGGGGALAQHMVEQRPGQRSGAGGEMMVEQRGRGIVGRAERPAADHAGQADPQQRSARKAKDRRMADTGGIAPAPGDQCQRKGGEARNAMDDQAAGKIHDAQVREPAAAPHRMGDRRIDEQQPERREGEEPADPCAFGDGADQQAGGEQGKGKLEQHEGGFGDRQPVAQLREIGEQQVRPAAKPGTARRISEAVADDRPGQRHGRDDARALRHDRERVADIDLARMAQHQSRQGRKQDQQRTHHHPAGVAAVGDGDLGISGLRRDQRGDQGQGQNKAHRQSRQSKQALVLARTG